ncbi:uncharacterized protein LOC111258242 [Setaria italica]|uniref:uncharacterized protein LOC111258242 n=1 Tax=Setaria italica TaxID=4555 RepID=UPI000BE51C8C|nr:uncharacterized protein LOC111258242 [Setaria italica]
MVITFAERQVVEVRVHSDFCVVVTSQLGCLFVQTTREGAESIEAAADEVYGATELATNTVVGVTETVAVSTSVASEAITLPVTAEAGVTADDVVGPTEMDMSEAITTPEAVSDATMSEVTGGGEGMGTSGDRIAAAAQVISSRVGDNLEAPPVAPSSVLNPSDLPKRLAGKAALVPRRSSKSSFSVDLSVVSTEPAADDGGHSSADLASAPIVDLTKKNPGPAANPSSTSLAAALL